MKYLFLAISSMLAIVAQMIAGNSFFLFNFLDIPLILITYWALYRSRVQALFVGSLAGILLDAVLGWPLGFNGFGKTLAAFLIGQTAKHFNVEEGWIRFTLLAGASFVSSLSVFLLFLLLGRRVSPVFLEASLAQAVITALVGVLVLAARDSYQQAHTGKAN
ncbi:MAG: rod shape-determining protein MreD [Acidobacteria bacterium]|jgi:rod shape-determining protein MreD|nr:rod shape-determining protein MreD [Acidobacteriota bacterium]